VPGAVWLRRSPGAVPRLILIRVAMVTLFAVVLYSVYTLAANDSVWQTRGSLVGALGATVCAVGVAFAVWARLHMGSNWGMPMTKHAHSDLVTSGPYSVIRHPIYSGIVLATVGSALAGHQSWLVSLVILGSYFVFSAGIEEKQMLKKFPGQYPAYKKKTKKFIPYLC
jgi:protein-S-isoprenylcysteine O-methyltransferase Ste14